MSFGDVYTVNPGDQPLPGPPVNLPSYQAQPRVIPRVDVDVPIAPRPVKTQSITNPYADLEKWEPPERAAGTQATPSAANPYADLEKWSPPQQQTPQAPVLASDAAVLAAPQSSASTQPSGSTPSTPAPNVSASQAAISGGLEGASFGTAPAIAGLAQAAGPEWQQTDIYGPEGNPAAPIVGAVKMIGNALSSHPDPQIRAAYDRGRQAALDDQRAAQDQHPLAFMTGQLAGSLAVPVGGAAGGASAAARIGRGALGGATGGALYGAGERLSQGGGATDIAQGAATGGATGALFGAGGAGALEGGSAVTSRIGNVIRGALEPDIEAARRVLAAHQTDLASRGGTPAFTAEEVAAANAAGTPVSLVDVGSERTRAVARSAANTSPEARAALTELADTRFENQSPRIAGFIRNITGGADAGADTAALQTAATKANKPAYARAYAAGSRPLWSPELERLAGSGAVADAARGAARRGNDRAIASGFGAFNPKVTVKNGLVTISKGGGVPAHPDLQFWDYTQRELVDKANAAARAGRNEEASAIGTINRQLKAELDRLVPEFRNAREGAAQFFGAQDALEAGRKFVMNNADIGQARQALAKMSAPERELFARGFASELAGKIEQTRDRNNVINSVFLDSHAARNKIQLALGPQRAGQLEALLRAETIVDQLRRKLGGSDTAQKLTELGLAGGAGALVEYVHSGEVNPASLISGALLFAAAKKGAAKIDERVARRVGEMLASNDPQVLKRGVQAVAGSPVLFDLMRRATEAGARVGAHHASSSLPAVQQEGQHPSE